MTTDFLFSWLSLPFLWGFIQMIVKLSGNRGGTATCSDFWNCWSFQGEAERWKRKTDIWNVSWILAVLWSSFLFLFFHYGYSIALIFAVSQHRILLILSRHNFRGTLSIYFSMWLETSFSWWVIASSELGRGGLWFHQMSTARDGWPFEVCY